MTLVSGLRLVKGQLVGSILLNMVASLSECMPERHLMTSYWPDRFWHPMLHWQPYIVPAQLVNCEPYRDEAVRAC